MKKCQFCAEEVQDEAVVCKHCGRNLNKQSTNNTSLYILSVLIPIIGIVIGATYMTKSDPREKKLGESILAWSILFLIVWGVGSFMLFNQTLISNEYNMFMHFNYPYLQQ